MPGEKSENINGEEMLGGGGSPLISNGEEDMGSNEVSRASSSSSPSLAAKTKKVRNTKCLQGPRPIAKHVKIRTDRCKRIRKFLGRQRSVTGLPIANVLSQSMSRREVAKLVQALLESTVIHPNPDEAVGLLLDVKEQVKEEPRDEVEATAASLSSSGQTGYEAHEDDDVEEMNDDAIDAKVLDDDIQQWSEEKLKREQHMELLSRSMEIMPELLKELKSAKTLVNNRADEVTKAEEANATLRRQVEKMTADQEVAKAEAEAVDARWKATVKQINEDHETAVGELKSIADNSDKAHIEAQNTLISQKRAYVALSDQLKCAKAALGKANSAYSQFRARFESAERKLRDSEQEQLKQGPDQIDLRYILKMTEEHKNYRR